jgi:hypothetical protein
MGFNLPEWLLAEEPRSCLEEGENMSILGMGVPGVYGVGGPILPPPPLPPPTPLLLPLPLPPPPLWGTRGRGKPVTYAVERPVSPLGRVHTQGMLCICIEYIGVVSVVSQYNCVLL